MPKPSISAWWPTWWTGNWSSAAKIAVAASSEFGVPLLDLDALDLDMEAVKSVDQRLLAKHRVLPLLLRGKRLFLGVSDPTAHAAIDEIKFQSGVRVDPIIVEQDKLDALVGKALEAVDTSMSSFDEDDFDLESLQVSGDDDVVGDDVARDDIEDAPVVRFVNKIMLDAIKRGASDIHFEPYEKNYRVRTRLDGVLKQVASPPLALAGKVTARLKVMSRLDIAERRVPQDGRIKLRLSKNRAIDFRVNTCPTLFGEKVVLRILDPTAAKLGIEVLGYEDFQRKLYLDALAKPYGMILVTGPTGSGKTVSLYTGINILNTEDRNISTCEDPVEINVPGINQVNVNPKVGLTFASALQSLPAPGPGRDHGRRNPRPRNRRDGHQGCPDRPPGALHPAHQRCAAHPHAHGGHGRQALCHRHLGTPDHRPASGPSPLRAMQGAA